MEARLPPEQHDLVAAALIWPDLQVHGVGCAEDHDVGTVVHL